MYVDITSTNVQNNNKILNLLNFDQINMTNILPLVVPTYMYIRTKMYHCNKICLQNQQWW